MIVNFARGNPGRTDHHQSIRQQLYELQAQGIMLHNERITVEDHAEWDQRFEQWYSRILNTAGILDPKLRATLSPLGIPPRGNRGGAVNADHHLAKYIISETQIRVMNYFDQSRS